jgi:hypothetical protein
MIEISQTELISGLIAKNTKKRDNWRAQLHQFESKKSFVSAAGRLEQRTTTYLSNGRNSLRHGSPTWMIF